jgi:hypothetical protein
MTTILGEGEFKFRVDLHWAKLPDGIVMGEIGSVAVDSRDDVYVFNRGPHPMLIFDRDGNYLRSWGEDMFVRPHGLHIGPDETLWCTDDMQHSVRQCTLDGKVLLEITTPGTPVPYGGKPFCRCTHTALSPKGEIYVSDGYANNCVHKYTPDGKYIKTWGKSGTAPGEFNLPHNICCDVDGWVYVADRESHRIQVFDGDGRYETQWNNLHRPSAMFMPTCHCPYCYVGECGPVMEVNRDAPNLGASVSILDNKGQVLARLGASHAGPDADQFISPHGITVDSHGDIYVGEVSHTAWGFLRPGQPRPDNLPVLRKLIKIQ